MSQPDPRLALPVSDELTGWALHAGSGDRIALAAVIRASQDDLWPVACWLAGTAAAEQLLIEVYRQANDALARYSGHPPARFWLLHLLWIVWRSQVPWWRRKDLRLGRRRMAFALVQFLGLSYPAAAQALHCTPADIRAWVAHARTDLITGAAGYAVTTNTRSDGHLAVVFREALVRTELEPVVTELDAEKA